MEERNNLEVKSLEVLIAENAAAARAAKGTPTLTIPSIEQDAGLRIRHHVLQRAVLPTMEHIKKRAKEEVKNKQKQELLKSKEVLLLEEYEEKEDNVNDKTTKGANLSSALVAIAQTNKRARADECIDNNQVGNDKETLQRDNNNSSNKNSSDNIISSNPLLLRARHELVLRQSTSSDVLHANNTTNASTCKKESNALVMYTSSTGDKAPEGEELHYVAPPKWKLAKVLVGHQGWV